MRIALEVIAICLLLNLCVLSCQAQQGGVGFNELMDKLEQDTLEFAKEIERLYQVNKCNITVLEECSQANYDHCMSDYSEQQCVGGGPDDLFGLEYKDSTCGDLDSPCSSLRDFTASNIYIPAAGIDENGDPSDPLVIDTICFTKDADEYLVRKLDQDTEYWKALGVGPRPMFFGSHTGVTRFFPATPSFECGGYDPRVRPWYGAARSGPKTVVLLLDTSSVTMTAATGDIDHLQILKEAAKRVIVTLGSGDRMAVITFSGESLLLELENNNGYVGRVYTASTLNKNTMIEKIDGLVVDASQTSGDSKYITALELAYEVLEQSADAIDCRSAVLLFTANDEDVDATIQAQADNLVREHTAQVLALTGNPVVLFSFSIAPDSNIGNDRALFSRDLACGSPTALWSVILDENDIATGLSGYYLFFSIRVSEFEDFVAWAEPYNFAVGNDLGTTVSSPVFDRSIDPPVFLGVVGVDIAFSAFDAALRIDNNYGGSAETIERFVSLTGTRCRDVTGLSPCEVEALRQRATRNGAYPSCANTTCNSTELIQVEEATCDQMDSYPEDLWANRNYQGISFFERACCIVGETTPSDQCPSSNGLLVGWSLFVIWVPFFLLMFQT